LENAREEVSLIVAVPLILLESSSTKTTEGAEDDV